MASIYAEYTKTEFTLRHRFRILIPLLVTISVGMLISVAGLYWHLRSDIEQEVERHTAILRQLIPRRLEGYARSMHIVLDALEHNAKLRAALRKKDRETLLAQTLELFRKLKNEHLITQFYFSGPDQINILRVHAPARHGDRIDHIIPLNSQDTGQFSWV